MAPARPYVSASGWTMTRARRTIGEGGGAPRRMALRARKAATSRALVRNICVYCGSNTGTNPAYAEAARRLGKAAAEEGIGLVYGGGGLGLMGELARAAIAHGGRVTGIIPAFLSEKERMLREADELVVVEDMHQRKKLMFERADAFVALPGGYGTLDEFCEVLTWAQLGLHQKPCGLLNVDGYFNDLLALFKHALKEGFLHPIHSTLVLAESDPQKLLELVLSSRVPRLDKWLDRTEV